MDSPKLLVAIVIALGMVLAGAMLIDRMIRKQLEHVRALTRDAQATFVDVRLMYFSSPFDSDQRNPWFASGAATAVVIRGAFFYFTYHNFFGRRVYLDSRQLYQHGYLVGVTITQATFPLDKIKLNGSELVLDWNYVRLQHMIPGTHSSSLRIAFPSEVDAHRAHKMLRLY